MPWHPSFPQLKIPVNVSDPITNPSLETKYANQPLHNFTDCPCAFQLDSVYSTEWLWVTNFFLRESP